VQTAETVNGIFIVRASASAEKFCNDILGSLERVDMTYSDLLIIDSFIVESSTLQRSAFDKGASGGHTSDESGI
jgi:hypothetical protein